MNTDTTFVGSLNDAYDHFKEVAKKNAEPKVLCMSSDGSFTGTKLEVVQRAFDAKGVQYVEYAKGKGQLLVEGKYIYAPGTGRWRVEGKGKWYWSKSPELFIENYVKKVDDVKSSNSLSPAPSPAPAPPRYAEKETQSKQWCGLQPDPESAADLYDIDPIECSPWDVKPKTMADLGLVCEQYAIDMVVDGMKKRGDMGLDDEPNPKLLDAIGFVMGNIMQRELSDIPTSNGFYPDSRKKNLNPAHLTGDWVRSVINWLDLNDWIELAVNYSSDERHGHARRWRKSTLLKWAVFRRPDDPVILFTRSLGNGKRLLSAPDETPAVAEMAAEIQRYKDLINQHDIQLPTPRGEYRPLSKSAKITRVFNRADRENPCYDFGGRLYAPWQNIPSAERSKILISGEPVVEVDYSGLHINMARCLLDLPVLDDPYADVPAGVDRKAVKFMALVCMNSGDRKTAISAYNGHSGRRDGKAMYEICETLLADIKPLMADDYGAILMRLDSAICMDILTACTEQRIPCLSVHDSYIVPASHEATIKQLMSHYAAERGFPALPMK